jgi:hypothetical protein
VSILGLGLLAAPMVATVAVLLVRLPTQECDDPTCPLRRNRWHSHTDRPTRSDHTTAGGHGSHRTDRRGRS